MKRRHNKISGQFSARLVEMLESPAYRALSLSGRRVLDRVEIEHAHHGGTDNGRLPVTFDHFVEYGMHRHSIAPGIREAVALGFLEITEPGRAGNAESRAPNRFRLTYRYADGGQGDGSHEWRRIQSLDDAEQLAHAARKAKAPKKTKNQCRKMPAFGDKNRHRTSKSPVTKTGTKNAAKTATTSISRDIAEETARDARPSKGAQSSGLAVPVSTGSPPDSAPAEWTEVIQNRVATKLGKPGWSILMGLSSDDLDMVTELERRGELDGAALQLLLSRSPKKETAA